MLSLMLRLHHSRPLKRAVYASQVLLNWYKSGMEWCSRSKRISNLRSSNDCKPLLQTERITDLTHLQHCDTTAKEGFGLLKASVGCSVIVLFCPTHPSLNSFNYMYESYTFSFGSIGGVETSHPFSWNEPF